MKLELLLNSIKNENSRYKDKFPNLDKLEDFNTPTYYKNFFKTPLTVNNCTESMISATYANH
jgi:hypothetical protein